MTNDQFEKILKNIKGIKCHKSDNPYEILLPHNTSREDIQFIIDESKKMLLVSWHIIFTEPDEINPEPDIRIYWD